MKIPNLLSTSQCDNLLEKFKKFPNQVYHTTNPTFRFKPSAIGHFLVCEMSLNECVGLWGEVQKNMPWASELVTARILFYKKGCGINPHIDSSYGEQDSNHSIIVQLNDPEQYKGGTPYLEEDPILLEQGDAVVYNYNRKHSVSTVEQGHRFVLNLRVRRT